jgi:protein-tyrosine phosphatase
VSAAYPGLLGFREVAGLPTADGRRLRPGLLYRSGTPQFLTADAARALHAATGIRTVVDLRLPHEVDREGSGPLADLPVRHVRVPFRIRELVAPGSAVAPMDPDDPLVTTYLRYLDDDAAAVAAVVAALAGADALPALVHCTVGKDRTGVAVALLLDVLGVPRAAIAEEYAAGGADVAPAMERLRAMASYGDAVDVYPPQAWTAPPDVVLRFLDAVDARHGGVRALLARAGVDDHLLAALAARLTTTTDQEGSP